MIFVYLICVGFIGFIIWTGFTFYVHEMNRFKTNKKWKHYDHNYKSLGYKNLTAIHEKALKEDTL